MSSRTTLPAALLLLALGTAACGSPGVTSGPSPSGSAATPSASPIPGGLVHPTGADEIVLRFDEGGGFVPPQFFAAHVPYFTLYGDGTVVFLGTVTTTGQSPDGPMIGQPVRTAKLDEDQVQALLQFALRDGGLAIARGEYRNASVADAPTAVFQINAAGASRTVSVVALGFDAQPGPDSAIKAALVKLAQRLRDFDRGGTLTSDPYLPKAYRGVLRGEAGAQGVKVREWPWPSLVPADFKLPPDVNALQQRTRVLTADEAAAVGVKGFENGVLGGLWYRGPDKALYSFVLRPLLPDETA